MVQWKRLGEVVTKEARPVWLLLSGLLGTWCVSYVASSCPEDHVLYAGTILQLLGLGTVAIGIRELQKMFGTPSLLKRFGTWLQHLKNAFCKSTAGSGVLEAANVVCTATVGIGSLTANTVPTLEERIDALEQALAEFRKQHDEHVSETQANITRVEGLVQVEGYARQEGDTGLLNKMEAFAVGGIHLEVVGFIWLLLGTLGTSIPKVIANWVPSILFM